MLNVTIAGASGFLGKNLLKTLSRDKNINIKALSRSFRKDESDNLKWQQADLFSLSSTTDALVDTDVAIFLVHSMLPATRLFQGNFQDTDLIIADNFVRAARRNKV
ncbi:NAD(P)H-binding protein, partial [Bacteriovorax sp. DB6_IX]|uniref:NAD(P)H-binding protein n=1 Tax=Bacteriovorax sp. DB6_IX TaxID=1353530 RepID=UPI000389F1BB